MQKRTKKRTAKKKSIERTVCFSPDLDSKSQLMTEKLLEMKQRLEEETEEASRTSCYPGLS